MAFDGLVKCPCTYTTPPPDHCDICDDTREADYYHLEDLEADWHTDHPDKDPNQ